jgi:hypothetical protein
LALSSEHPKGSRGLAEDPQRILLVIVSHIRITIQLSYVGNDDKFRFKFLYGVRKPVDYDACKLMVSESPAYVQSFQNVFWVEALLN